MGRPVRFPFRVFLSLVPFEDGFIGLLREHNPEKPWTESDLRLVRYDEKRRLIQDDFFMAGEDPRCFLSTGAPMALTWRYDGSKWSYFLLDLIARTCAELHSDTQGKNFVPFVHSTDAGTDLFIIQNLSPLVLSKLDPVTGVLHRARGKDVKLLRDHIGPWRGGTYAKRSNTKLYGYGHLSEKFDIHQPFLWSLEMFAQTPEIGVEILKQDKMICDPTSFWTCPHTGDDLLLCTETKFRWSVTQPCQAVLYRVAPTNE